MRTYAGLIHLSHPGHLFIDGHWTSPIERQDYFLIDPSTEERHDGFALGGVADVRAAITAARRAFDTGGWPRQAPTDRARMIDALAEALEARRSELEEAWTLQIGALKRMRTNAISNGLGHFRRAAALARSLAFEERAESAAGDARICREPIGVVAAIASWNGPLLQMAGKVAPALAAGCTVVMKPAAQTPIEALIVAECIEAAGFPPGVFNLVFAEQPAVEQLTGDAAVDMVAFTGSTAVGRSIARVCAHRIARYTLELGGKSAAIVLEDADIAAVGKTMARTIIALSGQLCTMLSRVIVHESRHDALAEAIAAEMARVNIGDSRDPASEMGPIASSRQRESIERFVERGRRNGARLIYGGARPPRPERGYFFQPTLFADVPPEAELAREEIFGPVLSLIKARNDEEAIRIANDSIYGLHGSVFTRDKGRALEVARRIRTGSFAQNGMKLDFALPFGGCKQSGVGREGGMTALDGYLETKTILLDK